MDAIAWAESAMLAARTRLDIATENLANVSTDGYRRTIARGFLTASGVRIASVPSSRRGALRQTGRPDDLAIVGAGAFRVEDDRGAVTTTRDGAFVRARDGTLRDPLGRTLLGKAGPLRLPPEAAIDTRGRSIAHGKVLDRIPLPPGSRVQAGYLESAGVDAISEMIDVLAAQRSFESAEKVVASIDQARQKATGDVAAVK